MKNTIQIYEEFDEIVRRVHSSAYQKWPIYTNISIPPYEAKMKLAQHVQVRPKFRNSIDKWLCEYFGTHPVIIVATDPNSWHKLCFFCHPSSYEAARKTIRGTV